MLVLKLTMLEGRSQAQKTELMRRLAESAAQHFDVPLAESYVAEMREFLEFVRSGATPTNTAVAGRESVRLATAIRAAAEAAP